MPVTHDASMHTVPSEASTCWHPFCGSQESTLQAFWSSQFSAAPPMQLPPAHVSPVVHLLPSSQGRVLSVCVQPAARSQASVVH